MDTGKHLKLSKNAILTTGNWYTKSGKPVIDSDDFDKCVAHHSA